MQVREVMSEHPCFVRPETPLKEVAELMQDHDCGCLPVGENDRLIGMISDRDIVMRAVAQGKDTRNLTARDLMSRGVKYVFDDSPLGEASELMRTFQIRRLVVLNRDKRMVGMLALSDLATRGREEELTGATEADVCRTAA